MGKNKLGQGMASSKYEFLNKHERRALKQKNQEWQMKGKRPLRFKCECGAEGPLKLILLRSGLYECSECKARILVTGRGHRRVGPHERIGDRGED